MPNPIATRRAFAKINLTLAVGPAVNNPGGPRHGWHPIASWMAAIDLADEVRVERLAERQPTKLSAAWAADAPMPTPMDWPEEEDLALRAHAAVERAVGRALPASITLTKRIPVGGGLGGGSSDAAAALLAINDLFRLDLSAARLAEIGAGLGSDVPFFLDAATEPGSPPAPAIVSGFGERLARVTRNPARIALIIPPFSCPTADVYRAFDRLPGSKTISSSTLSWTLARSPLAHGSSLFNQLADAAFEVRPELSEIRDDAERALKQPVHVTGSGSCLFTILKPGGGTGALEQALSTPMGPRAMVLESRVL